MYPKVIMKTLSSIYISCYSSKKWIELQKRKQLVKRELNKIEPILELFSAIRKFRHNKWKRIKKDYNVV